MDSWDLAPNNQDFLNWRESWLKDNIFHIHNLEAIQDALTTLDRLKYAYLWDWCGVPIIRHPSDIVLAQEYIYKYRPTICIEIGVARGGGVVFYASMMKMIGLEPCVLGIDIKIHPHTKLGIEQSGTSGVHLIETSSTSEHSRLEIAKRVKLHNSIFVTLDGNHQHENVLKELQMLDEILPSGSVILVADTIAEMTSKIGSKERNGYKGNSPKTALVHFLENNHKWVEFEELNRKSIFGESPSGWIVKKKE